MAPRDKTHYEVLGLRHGASATNIERAYKQYRAEMLRADQRPDPDGAALVKVAYETLMDPERRAEYDATFDEDAPAPTPAAAPDAVPPPPPAPAPAPAPRYRKRGETPWGAIVGVVLVGAIAAGAYLYMSDREEKAALAAVPTTRQIVEDVSGLIGGVQSALMSGEVRQTGLAVATAVGEMVTTCHNLPPGAQISVYIDGAASRAEVLRAHSEIDICTLAVRGIRAPVQFRSGDPSVNEKVFAMVLDGARTVARPGRVVRSIADPDGPVFELEIPGPAVPTGAAVMDLEGRLVGIVSTPHSFGEAPIVALGTARIARSRAAAGKGR